MPDTRVLTQSGLIDAPLFVFIGDSNTRGSAEDEASVSYTQDPKVLAFGGDTTFREYTPRTFTGVSNGSDNGRIGGEMEFTRQFRAANPTKTCYLYKSGTPGAGATKLNTGTFTGSISGNALTVTAGSVAIGDMIYGAGIPSGVYVSSGTGPYSLVQVSQQIVPYFADTDVSVNLTIASTTLSKAGLYLSHHPGDGKILYGVFRQITQSFNTLTFAGKRPYLAGVFLSLGANDASDATAAGAFVGGLSAIYRAFKSSPFCDPRTVFVLDRTPTTGGGANVNTVRSAAATFKGNFRDVRLLDCDTFGKNTADPIHYNLAGQVAKGAGIYSLWAGAAGL